MTIQCPAAIEFILKIHYRGAYTPDEKLSPGQKDYLTAFIRHELVVSKPQPEVGDLWTTSERGKAWVELICDTPLPEQQWIDPRTVQV